MVRKSGKLVQGSSGCDLRVHFKTLSEAVAGQIPRAEAAASQNAALSNYEDDLITSPASSLAADGKSP